MTCYYKTNAPEVIAALDAAEADRVAMWAQFRVFAKLFGECDPLSEYSVTGHRFLGLRFSPPRDPSIWTKPDKDSGIQRPRAHPVRCASPSDKDAHAALLKLWSENYPKARVNVDALYKSFGTDWGSLFICGVAYFKGVDGFVYVSTGATLAPHMTEILASDCMGAKKAYVASKEAA